MTRRVVVTGIGMVTPLGPDVSSNWDALMNGRSGIGRITKFDPAPYETQIAGEVEETRVQKAGGDELVRVKLGLGRGEAGLEVFVHLFRELAFISLVAGFLLLAAMRGPSSAAISFAVPRATWRICITALPGFGFMSSPLAALSS